MKKILFTAVLGIFALLCGTFTAAAFDMSLYHQLLLNPVYFDAFDAPKKAPRPLSLSQTKNLVRRISKGSYTVNAIFERDGLQGVVITSRSGNRLVGWLVANHLFLGSLYNEKGEDITEMEARGRKALHPVEALAAQDAASARSAAGWKDIQNALSTPLEGTEDFPAALYMFTWPGCSTCREVTAYLKQSAADKRIGVRLIPVGGTAPAERDGARLLGRKVEDVRDGLRRNADLLEHLTGRLKVPCLVWRTPTGTPKHRLMNRKSDIEKLLDELRGRQAPKQSAQ